MLEMIEIQGHLLIYQVQYKAHLDKLRKSHRILRCGLVQFMETKSDRTVWGNKKTTYMVWRIEKGLDQTNCIANTPTIDSRALEPSCTEKCIFAKVAFVKMSKIKEYQNKIGMLSRPRYGIVKIRLGSILKFLLSYLLNFLKCTRGYKRHFFFIYKD